MFSFKNHIVYVSNVCFGTKERGKEWKMSISIVKTCQLLGSTTLILSLIPCTAVRTGWMLIVEIVFRFTFRFSHQRRGWNTIKYHSVAKITYNFSIFFTVISAEFVCMRTHLTLYCSNKYNKNKTPLHCTGATANNRAYSIPFLLEILVYQHFKLHRVSNFWQLQYLWTVGANLYASFLSFFSSASSPSAPLLESRLRLRVTRHCLGAGNASIPSTLWIWRKAIMRRACCELLVMSSRSWLLRSRAASIGSFSQGSRKPGESGRRIPPARASNTRLNSKLAFSNVFCKIHRKVW